MATRIVMSIQSALDHLLSRMNTSGFKNGESKGKKATVAVYFRLRCLRMFSICSTKLGINLELLSLWARLDCVVCRILDDKFSCQSAYSDAERFLGNIEPLVEEMDKWFIILSDNNLQQSTLAVVVIDDLIDSAVGYLEDFLVWHHGEYLLVQQIEALKKYLVSSRNFIRFATLLCADQHQEVQDLFSQIEGLAVSAAHLTLHIFSSEDNNDRMKSINSGLQLRIKPSHDYQLYEIHSQALARVKYSRDRLYAPILHHPAISMMGVIGYLCYLLDEMLQLKPFFSIITLDSQLELLRYGLRSLKTFFEKLPRMFDGEIGNITRVAICDVGVSIFSLYRKRDFVIEFDHGLLQDFVRYFEVIQLEFEENRFLYFSNSTVLDLLDSMLNKCKDHERFMYFQPTVNILSFEPTVKPDLVFLRSLMEKLVELRKHQEGLHQALWNLCIKVAYKYEFHVKHDMRYREHLEYISMSFPSIAAEMNIIKTASFKIFHDRTIEEDHGDIKTAFQTIISILCALDHLQSCLDNKDFEYDEPKRRIVFMMNRLRCLRTFVLCSTKWGNNDQLRTLLLRLDGVACTILSCEFGAGSAISDSNWFVDSMEDFDREMDKWFIDISYYELQQCSRSPTPIANLFGDIFDSLSENLEDFLSSPKSEELTVFEGRIDPLRETITFLKNFISFAKLICADQHQEVLDIFTQIEAFTLSAAHLTVYFFTRPRGFPVYRMESIISALELRIRPFQSPQFYAPALQTKDDPLIVMLDSIDSLLSLLWNMLLSDVALVAPSRSQLEKLDSGLRSLKVLLRKQPNKLDDRFMDMTRLATCHAGLVISSVDQNDIVIDHSLQEFQVILMKVKELLVDFPRTLMLGFLDFLLEYWTEMESSKVDPDTLISVSKIQEDLVFLKLLMGKLAELRNKQGDLHQALWNLGAATAYKIELLIDQLVLGDIANSFSTSAQSIAENMITIRYDSMEVFNVRKQEIVVQNITWASIDQVPSHSSTPTYNHFVGFIPEQTLIMNRLKRGSKKLQVVAIVGMPGLGKTTLATKLYSETSVVEYFNVRAWCSISQVFNQRKVLLKLLYHIQKKPPNEYGEKTVDDLAEEFCRSLKGRRYLIFMDDVWDIQVYNWLQIALPESSTGSRIILTTRHGNVATLDDEPVFLSQFSPRESFELLRAKVFPNRKDWPREIQELGMQIAEVCKGLPLTIVMVAGLLTTSKQEFWGNVLQSLRSGIISNTDQCERTIELSYNYLPDHLKPCFLSFAVFPEDYDISVKRLIWMWIAEGFVRKSGSKSKEEAATDCLNNLIGRSLVMNAKKRSTGGVKACRMHDLLRDFCLKKANEEFYLHRLEGKEGLLSFDDPGNMRRLCIFSEPEHFKKSRLYCPRLRSLLFFDKNDSRNGHDMSFLFRIFKLLRVLDMERVYLSFKSPSEIRFLMQLRYLAIQVDSDINPSIGNLLNLETFILKLSRGNKVTLPSTFWNLQKLRHLYSIFGHRPHGTRGIELPADNLESTCNLLDLESLTTLLSCNWEFMEKQLKKFPNIRQLKCHLSGNWIHSKTVSFSFLMQLESLSLSFSVDPTSGFVSSAHQCDLTLPKTIKKLTLYGCRWPWTMVSGIAGLPDLEVLKLLSSSFVGDIWHVEEDEFPQLKVLELSYLDIVKWTALDDQFPNLEKLILDNCHKLREIPECLEFVDTLELIEVINCSDCVAVSVKKVEEYQKEMGNSVLWVDVRPGW